MSSRTRDRSEIGYFEWQSPTGELGSRTNLGKLAPWIPEGSRILDFGFGCGGGYLLKNLDCRKLGTGIDPRAAEVARQNGVEVFGRTDDLPDSSPMCIGNLLAEAGFHVLESRPHIHEWPPGFGLWARTAR